MLDQSKTKSRLSLQEKCTSIFPDSNRVYPADENELWLEQPSAQKVVKSTTSSSSFELPETFKID